MFGFGKKKHEDLDDSSDMDFGADDSPTDGDGKFPPAQNAFDNPTPPPGMNDDGLGGSDFPSTPSLGSNDDGNDSFNSPSPSSPGAFEMGPQRKQMAASQVQPMQTTSPAQNNGISADKAELILAKLDNIKSMMDVLNQRMSTLESKYSSRGNTRW